MNRYWSEPLWSEPLFPAVIAHYSGTDNANSVAASLMTALNTSSPDVSAQLTTSGTGVILTSMPSGSYADFSFTATTASSAGFSTPSFSMSPTSGTMAQGSGTEIYAAGVSYEPNGDVANSNDNVNGSWAYTYDDFNRLLTAVSDTGEGCSEKYDNLGNRVAQAAYQGSCFNGTFTGSGNPFQISGLVYDQTGNVTNDGTYVYTYDSEERVSTVSTENAALIATYVYDAEGRRVRKIAASNSEDEIYDLSGHVVSAFSTTATTWLRGEVFAGGAHLATWSGATYFAHADWLGTERIRSTVVGGIDPGSQWTSLPFGEGSATPNPSPLHFTGKERDTESGLDYFGARYYASSMGRFMSPDWAAKATPVPYAKLDNPQSLNLYTYVGNNPLSRVDPDGHCDAPSGLKPGQVGICVASYIRTTWFKLIGRGDGRDTNGNGGTARIETHLVVDPKTGKVTNQGDNVGRSGVLLKDVGPKGTGQSQNTQGTVDAQGNTHFQVSQDAHSFYAADGKFLGSIDNHLNLEVTPDQKVGIDAGSTARDFPSLEVYRYTTDGTTMTTTLVTNRYEAGNGDALKQPETPLPTQAPQ